MEAVAERVLSGAAPVEGALNFVRAIGPSVIMEMSDPMTAFSSGLSSVVSRTSAVVLEGSSSEHGRASSLAAAILDDIKIYLLSSDGSPFSMMISEFAAFWKFLATSVYSSVPSLPDTVWAAVEENPFPSSPADFSQLCRLCVQVFSCNFVYYCSHMVSPLDIAAKLSLKQILDYLVQEGLNLSLVCSLNPSDCQNEFVHLAPVQSGSFGSVSDFSGPLSSGSSFGPPASASSDGASDVSIEQMDNSNATSSRQARGKSSVKSSEAPSMMLNPSARRSTHQNKDGYKFESLPYASTRKASAPKAKVPG